jgi:receptor protein-tyrosine kinase/non-specific protein-tyrosine kinase
VLVDCDLLGRRLTYGFAASELPGLLEALSSPAPQTFASQTPTRGLWVIPVGHADAQDACTLNADALRRLLGELRQHFDVVLIDAGPILGSIEAMIAAPEADGVLLVVSRRQHGRLVERAMAQLNTCAARLVGVVFNRATHSDLHPHWSGTSSSHASGGSGNGPTPGRRRWRPSRFGPLVAAVEWCLPVSADDGRHPA